MRIEPGYYKVRVKKGYFGQTTYHYLRVFVKDKSKFLQLDHGLPQKAEENEEGIIQDYVIVKKITRPIEIHKVQVMIKWKDEDGDSFEMGARNSYVLDRIFQLFPRLRKAFES